MCRLFQVGRFVGALRGDLARRVIQCRNATGHKYLFLGDELKILSKLQAFAGNLLCGAVCTNCFEKCTYLFANIKDDSRNAPKWQKNCTTFVETVTLNLSGLFVEYKVFIFVN